MRSFRVLNPQALAKTKHNMKLKFETKIILEYDEATSDGVKHESQAIPSPLSARNEKIDFRV